MVKEYENYHKHDFISNIYTPDTHIKTIDYINRIKELGYGCYYTTNHGSGGDVFESLTLCKQHGVRCIFGVEGYIVKNPLEKDKSNYHIVIIPKTNKARKKLNLITSKSNTEGYYYKPRISPDDLLTLDKDDVYITTACVAGILRDNDAIDNIFVPLMKHFGENLFLEVQNHKDPMQIEVNKKCIALSEKFGLGLIAANDSHYIYPEQSKDRQDFLRGKGIDYGDEDTYMLDFPDYDTMFNRFKEQGVLSDSQIENAMKNTLIFRECEDIDINKEIKMPSIYPNLSPDEKVIELKKHVAQGFQKIVKQESITGDKLLEYKTGIYNEMKVIEDTKEINTADYFLFNERLVDLAVNKYGGVLTRTGRGSCGGFYINRVLGMTQLDRFELDIKLYPERFMSTARLLENRALPDIDFNIVSQEPFVAAAKELLGEHGCYPMVAYGTMQIGEAFRNVCRTHGLDFDEYNEIAKNIENHENDRKWIPYIEEAKKYVDTVVSASVHPCAFLLDNKDIREEYGVVKIGDNICAMITSMEADEYKMLKDDFLLVTVWKLIDETFKLIGKPIITVKELLDSLNDDIWNIFANGITCTLNQVDGDWATHMIKQFKPRSVSDMAMFTACLRPFFEPWRDRFIERGDFTTNSPHLDELLKSTHSYIIFQENLMQYFEWLGVTPAESIGLIKKISKKKIHPEDFAALEERIKAKWLENTGSMDNFDDTWELVQSCMAYGFCVSGSTKLLRNGNGNGFVPTVEEMYNIMHNRQYALKSGHINLYKKYRHCGYGKGLSLCDDGMLRENDIVDIHFTGVRDVYRVTTENGSTIDCTMNHKFPTPSGLFELNQLNVGDMLYVKGGYRDRDKSYRLTKEYTPNYPSAGECGFQEKPNGASVIYDNNRKRHVKNSDCCEMCGTEYNEDKCFELHHIDLDRTNNNEDNFKWLCNSCHKKTHYQHNRNKRYERGLTTKTERIISIEYVGKENVYSITMADPNHTFVVDSGIVTSNCSAHAVATGIDSLYGAYLKANHPLEYYTVALTNYAGDMNRTSKLIAELSYFNIELKPIKFGKSGADYTMDKESNCIYKGIESIKFCNAQIADELLELSKNSYDNFMDLLKDIHENTSINSRQLNILIKLNFFDEYGNNKYLLNVIDIYDKFANVKIIAKNKMESLGLSDFLMTKYAAKETKSQWRELDNAGLIKELCSRLNNEKLDIIEQVRAEVEYLGGANYTNEKMANYYWIVVGYEQRYDPCKPSLVLRNIRSGEEVKTRIKQARVFKENQFGQFAILRVDGFTYEFRKKKVDGKWVDSDETEPILVEFEVIKNASFN